jgi:hypothetical protein
VKPFGFGPIGFPSGGGGGGGAAALPANNRMAMFGDSRTILGHGGLPATTTLGGLSSTGLQGALKMKLGSLIDFEPEISAFGISGQDIIQASTVPRPAAASLGADVLAASPIASIIMLLGINNGGDPNLAIGQSLWNAYISILDRWTSKFRIYILNELPVGKNAAGGLQGNLTIAAAAVHYQFSRDLLKLDKNSGHALSRPNVVVINSYDALLDVSSGTQYLNTQGMLNDGVHLASLGASTIADLMLASINATYPTAQRDPRKSTLITAKGPTVLGRNPLAVVQDGSQGILNPSFLSYNGGSAAPGNRPEIPDYWRIGTDTASNIAITVSRSEVDDEGYNCVRLDWSRASGGAAGFITIEAFPEALATLRTIFQLNDKVFFQARVKLDNPVNVSGIVGQGTLYTSSAFDVGGISTLGHAIGGSGLPVVAFPWMTYESRAGDSTTYISNVNDIINYNCSIQLQVGAGTTSGTIRVSRPTPRRYATVPI